MKRAKWLSVLLTGFFLLQLVACNGGTTGTEQAAPESDPSGLYTVDVYALGRAYRTPSEGDRGPRECHYPGFLRAQISIHYQGLEESCLQQVKLAVSTGKKVDLFPTFEMGVSVMVNYGLVTPLNDYLSLCGPEIQEEIPPEDWQCVTVNGMICGVPINREKATGRGFIYRKDLAERVGRLRGGSPNDAGIWRTC